MSEEQKQEEIVETPAVQEETPVVEEPQETVEELKARLDNARAENARKAQEIQRLKEEQEARVARSAEPVFNPQDLTTWKDHELKAVLKDGQYAAIHDQAQDLLDKRKFQRWQKDEQQKLLRMNSELERQQKYPETFDLSHPMAAKMTELMNTYSLDNSPAGRLVAARLASSELDKQKAAAAGRKAEQTRQTDVKANFQGDAGRPAPKVSDRVKEEELKKRAMAGDESARLEWMRLRVAKGL